MADPGAAFEWLLLILQNWEKDSRAPGGRARERGQAGPGAAASVPRALCSLRIFLCHYVSHALYEGFYSQVIVISALERFKLINGLIGFSEKGMVNPIKPKYHHHSSQEYGHFARNLV
jgi:hypothetical protein